MSHLILSLFRARAVLAAKAVKSFSLGSTALVQGWTRLLHACHEYLSTIVFDLFLLFHMALISLFFLFSHLSSLSPLSSFPSLSSLSHVFHRLFFFSPTNLNFVPSFLQFPCSCLSSP